MFTRQMILTWHVHYVPINQVYLRIYGYMAVLHDWRFFTCESLGTENAFLPKFTYLLSMAAALISQFSASSRGCVELRNKVPTFLFVMTRMKIRKKTLNQGKKIIFVTDSLVPAKPSQSYSEKQINRIALVLLTQS